MSADVTSHRLQYMISLIGRAKVNKVIYTFKNLQLYLFT